MISKRSFKVIEIETSFSKVKILKGLALINEAFPKEEFSMAYSGDKLKAYVNLLDLQRFRQQIEAIEKKLNLKPDNPFREVWEKIESIGSYGIKSGKRSFVDYNKERKVKGRKQKVMDRGMYFYAVDNNFSKTSLNGLSGLTFNFFSISEICLLNLCKSKVLTYAFILSPENSKLNSSSGKASLISDIPLSILALEYEVSISITL